MGGVRVMMRHDTTLPATNHVGQTMKLISYDEVQRKLGGDDGPSRRTIERMVERGEFVAPVQVSPRRVMFAEAEVDAWIENRKKHKAEVNKCGQ